VVQIKGIEKDDLLAISGLVVADGIAKREIYSRSSRIQRVVGYYH